MKPNVYDMHTLHTFDLQPSKVVERTHTIRSIGLTLALGGILFVAVAAYFDVLVK